MKKMNRHKGYTMIELLVVIPIAVIIIGLVAYIYLKSTGQLQTRVRESDLFKTLYLVDKSIQSNLQEEIHSCNFSKLKIVVGRKNVDITDILKSNFKVLQKVEFNCFEMDVHTKKLVKWRNAPEPVLIEYKGEVKDRGIFRIIVGSVLL